MADLFKENIAELPKEKVELGFLFYEKATSYEIEFLKSWPN